MEGRGAYRYADSAKSTSMAVVCVRCVSRSAPSVDFR